MFAICYFILFYAFSLHSGGGSASKVRNFLLGSRHVTWLSPLIKIILRTTFFFSYSGRIGYKYFKYFSIGIQLTAFPRYIKHQNSNDLGSGTPFDGGFKVSSDNM